MIVKFECHCCEQPIEVENATLGEKVNCPSCSNRITIVESYIPQKFVIPQKCDYCSSDDMRRVPLVWKQQSDHGLFDGNIDAAMRFNTFGIHTGHPGGISFGVWNIPFRGSLKGTTSNGSLLSYTLAPPEVPTSPSSPRKYSFPPPIHPQYRLVHSGVWYNLAWILTVFGWFPLIIMSVALENALALENAHLAECYIHCCFYSYLFILGMLWVMAHLTRKWIPTNQQIIDNEKHYRKDWEEKHLPQWIIQNDNEWTKYDESVEEYKKQLDYWENSWICMKCGNIQFSIEECTPSIIG